MKCQAALIIISLAISANLTFAQNLPSAASSTDLSKSQASHPAMKEHAGSNEIQKGEYEIIDTSGSTTRALCPYTCADRGIPQEHCKAFPSQNEPQFCYLQDTRIPSNAFEKK